MISIAMELLSTRSPPKVTLLWVVRNPDEYQLFCSELAQCEVTHTNFTAKCWITTSGNNRASFGSTYASLYGIDLSRYGSTEMFVDELSDQKNAEHVVNMAH